MGITKAGVKKRRETIRLRYGDDFQQRIAAKGGRNGSFGKGYSSPLRTNGYTGRERAIISNRIMNYNRPKKRRWKHKYCIIVYNEDSTQVIERTRSPKRH